jgi:outer membrane protein assembly factor BamB
MQRVIASAVAADGLAVVPFNRGGSIAAIRLDGSGDVSETHWAWRKDEIGSDACTPVLHDGKFYVLKDAGPDRGRLTCLDAKSGEKLWESNLPKAPQVFYSSPILVGDQIYCVREDGMIFSGKITKDGLSDIKSHALEEGVIASPVSVGGRLIFRTDSSLFCFGED